MEAKTKKKIAWGSLFTGIASAIAVAYPHVAPFLPPQVGIGILIGTTVVNQITGALHKPAEESDPKGLTAPELVQKTKEEVANLPNAS